MRYFIITFVLCSNGIALSADEGIQRPAPRVVPNALLAPVKGINIAELSTSERFAYRGWKKGDANEDGKLSGAEFDTSTSEFKKLAEEYLRAGHPVYDQWKAEWADVDFTMKDEIPFAEVAKYFRGSIHKAKLAAKQAAIAPPNQAAPNLAPQNPAAAPFVGANPRGLAGGARDRADDRESVRDRDRRRALEREVEEAQREAREQENKDQRRYTELLIRQQVLERELAALKERPATPPINSEAPMGPPANAPAGGTMSGGPGGIVQPGNRIPPGANNMGKPSQSTVTPRNNIPQTPAVQPRNFPVQSAPRQASAPSVPSRAAVAPRASAPAAPAPKSNPVVSKPKSEPEKPNPVVTSKK